jgi:subtilisin family serine protease
MQLVHRAAVSADVSGVGALFEAAPRLPDGRSLFDAEADPRAGLAPFRAPPGLTERLGAELRGLGLTVLAENPFTLSVAAPAGWSQSAGVVPRPNEAGIVVPIGCSVLAGLAPVPPTAWHSATPLPPPTAFFSLRAPVDMLTALNGTHAAISGHDGRGVTIAIVDSGCDVSHPFFTGRQAEIAVTLGPGMSGPTVDTVGHGTMIAGSILSIAPAAKLQVIKTTDDLSLAAFKAAVAMTPRPQIIQNAWGHVVTAPEMTPYDKATYAAITSAVEDGIVAVFAAGNQKIIFPPQVPAALVAGGAYVDVNGLYRASDYASGYVSALFAHRTVPDVCGLVGPAPNGVYIALPTAPRSTIDRYFAEHAYPQGDGGLPDDGWAVISGTSSASAQVSATTALLLQVRPDLDSAGVKAILSQTARRIDVGFSAQGGRSGPPYHRHGLRPDRHRRRSGAGREGAWLIAGWRSAERL